MAATSARIKNEVEDAKGRIAEDRPHVLHLGFVTWRIPMPSHATARFHLAYSETLSVYAARPIR